MITKPRVFFRADGHANMGLGHVIRSLALADMLKDNFECHFIIRDPLSTLQMQILEVCKSIITLPRTTDDVSEAETITEQYFTSEDIVVLDGYHFQTEYQRIIKNKGCKLVCIDDIHACHFVADVVINHAGGIGASDYSAEPYTQFCLGLQYALLRRPFLEAARNRHYSNREKNSVFICLGGADPSNATLDVLKQCEKQPAIAKCYLVIGGAYQYRAELQEYIEHTDLDIKLLSNLSDDEMVAYMKKCSRAITPPSTVAYEYLSVGGELYLKVIADNQKEVYQYFINSGLAFDVENFSKVDRDQLNHSFTKQQRTFDGRQEKRFRELFQSLSLNIRQATLDDLTILFNWANDPETRKQSFNSKPILIEDHTKWYKQKLDDPSCILYIVSCTNTSIGQIRFDCKDKETIISFSLDHTYRGKGLGLGILRKGLAQFRKDCSSQARIVGFVKKVNVPSIRAFRSLGFAETEAKEYPDSFKYILS